MQMKSIFKYVIRFLIILIAIVIIAVGMLYIPFIQDFARDKAVALLSEKTGWKVSVEKVRLKFPLDVEIAGVDVQTVHGDTILYLSTFETGVSLMPLFHKEVVVDQVLLRNARMDLSSIVESLSLKGRVGDFDISGIRVDLGTHQGAVAQLSLSDTDVKMELFASAPDTVKKENAPLDWSFKIGGMQIRNSGYALRDTTSALDLSCFVGNGVLREGDLSLSDNTYQVQELLITESSYRMDLDSLAPASGFDPMHMNITDIRLNADSIFNRGMRVKANIKDGAMKDRSGFELSSLKASYEMDSVMMRVSDLEIVTPYSNISGNAFWDQSIFKVPRKGDVKGMLSGLLGHRDVIYLTATYAPELVDHLPQSDLNVNLDLEGDMKYLELRNLRIDLPKSLLFTSKGFIKQLDNVEATQADIRFNGDFADLSFIPYMLPEKLQQQIAIPSDILLEGSLKAEKGLYEGNIEMKERASRLHASGKYHPVGDKYDLSLSTDSVHLERFLPTSGMGVLTMEVAAKGAGFDPMAPSTYSEVKAGVQRFDILKYTIRTLSLDAKLKDTNYEIALNGADSILLMNLNMAGVLSPKLVSAKLESEIKNVDLYRLNILNSDIAIAMKIGAEASSNLKDIYKLDANLAQIQITDNGIKNRLGDLQMTVDVNADSARLLARNGDMILSFDAAAGLDSLTRKMEDFSAQLTKQMNERMLNVETLQKLLPQMFMQITAGTQNVFYGWMKNTMNLPFKSFDLQLSNETPQGIRMNGIVNDLRRDTLLINQLAVNLKQHDDLFEYQLSADSENKNLNKAFSARANGEIRNDGLDLNVLLKDGRNKTSFDLGATLTLSKEDITLRFNPYNPVLLYKTWTINENNFITYTHEKRIKADFILQGEKKMQLSIVSVPGDTIRESDELNVKLTNFDLGQISTALPALPPFSGIFNIDTRVDLRPQGLDAIGSATLDELYFNKQRLGDLALKLDYQTGEGRGQRGDASVLLDKREVIQAKMVSLPNDSVPLTASLNMNGFPLNLINPFIPEAMASLYGTASGEITASGSVEKPIINGFIDMDTARVNITYANADYKFDEKRLVIENNVLHFNDYKITAYNNNPIQVNGTFNFSDLNRMMADLRISGQNVELLNVRKERNQMVFGRAIMNINTTVTGPVNFLKVRGSLNLLSGTNVTYVMLDAPVSAQNRVNNLVTFTSFTDTIDSNLKIPPKKVTLSGIDMLVTVNIAPSVQVAIDLSANGDDHVELRGGGDLAFRLSPMGATDLSGRYTLSGGFVRYNLPVLPVAKTFDIMDGSYVEWSGQLMNPYINIKAYERIRSTVTEEGKGSRVVIFEPMVIIKNRLENLDVSFTVEAPEDITIQNQLAQMTAEERSKQAMNLIITQMYTGPGTTSKANTNNALNAFIQKEINQFAGSALKGVDLSIGIDTYDEYGTDNQSSKRTDYSFRFSKKFFNDRFRIVFGGKVSSGQESATDRAQSFIDDITLEYTLDQTGTRYLKLFHHTGYESVLEGEIVETGVGIVLRRKIRKLKQLFIFNEKKRQQAINADPEKQGNQKNSKENQDAKTETK